MLKKYLRDVFTSGIMGVDVDATVEEAILTMRDHRISSVPVLDDGRPLGIVTERQVVRQMCLRGNAFRSRGVREVMSSPVFTATGDIHVYEAYNLMELNRIRHLVVVDEKGLALGMVTQSDLVVYLGDELFIEYKTIAQIMTRSIITIAPDVTVSAALSLMASKCLSCLVVAEGDTPVGIVTERDGTGMLIDRKDLTAVAVREVMSAPLLTVNPTDAIYKAAAAMRRESCRRLVVVDKEGRLAGLITQSDLVKGIREKYIHELKEVILRNEEKYLLTFKTSALGIFRSTLDGRFIDANPALARILGYSSPAELTREVTDIARQVFADPAQLETIIHDLLRQKRMVIPLVRFCGKDYRDIWAKLHLRLARDSDEEASYIEGFVEDVTERKRIREMEQALDESESRTREAFALMGRMAVELGRTVGELNLGLAGQADAGIPPEQILRNSLEKLEDLRLAMETKANQGTSAGRLRE